FCPQVYVNHRYPPSFPTRRSSDLHYSKSSQSVKERIKMLDEMIANDALIYQVYDNEYFGVEVLSKKQYINLVSLPTSSLKNFTRSEEHTSELQSRENLVCRLLLEK